MAIIDDIMDEYAESSPVAVSQEHRRLRKLPSRTIGDYTDRINALITIMWYHLAIAVAAEWSCDCCKHAAKPCFRMTMAGLIEYVVRNKEIIFLREYAFNCLRCIRSKSKCVITTRVVNAAHPAPGIECTFDRNGPSSPLMAVPKQGLAPADQKVTREHEQHQLPLLGYSEDEVRRYLRVLRKAIIKEDSAALVTPQDLRALDSRGSIEAFVTDRTSMLQQLYAEYTNMSAGMKRVLDNARDAHYSVDTAAAICRDFSKTLFKSVRKTLKLCPDSHIHKVEQRGDQLVCYRVSKRHAVSFHRRVLAMIEEGEALTSEDEADDGNENDDDMQD